jgi:hypothetical protein
MTKFSETRTEGQIAAEEVCRRFFRRPGMDACRVAQMSDAAADDAAVALVEQLASDRRVVDDRTTGRSLSDSCWALAYHTYLLERAVLETRPPTATRDLDVHAFIYSEDEWDDVGPPGPPTDSVFTLGGKRTTTFRMLNTLIHGEQSDWHPWSLSSYEPLGVVVTGAGRHRTLAHHLIGARVTIPGPTIIRHCENLADPSLNEALLFAERACQVLPRADARFTWKHLYALLKSQGPDATALVARYARQLGDCCTNQALVHVIDALVMLPDLLTAVRLGRKLGRTLNGNPFVQFLAMTPPDDSSEDS